MTMYNPAHPGEILREYLGTVQVGVAAKKLRVARSTLSRLLNGRASFTAAMALRLADAKLHAGSATQLDVLTSQVALTQAKTDQLTANYNYLVALANVRKAIGLSDALVRP